MSLFTHLDGDEAPAVATSPIADASSRFALGAPNGQLDTSDAVPSDIHLRPFALRGARAFEATPNPVEPVPEYRYDPVRQIAVLADGEVPVFKHTNPKTQETTGSPDSDRPGHEDMRPDWQNG